MPERQRHGFNEQSRICDEYGLIESTDYTSLWDAHTVDGMPVSIKVHKKGSELEFGDIFRQSKIDEDFYLYVSEWENKKNNIVRTVRYFIPSNAWSGLFYGGQESLDKFSKLLYDITNDRSDDEVWKSRTTELRNEWGSKTSNIMRPRFKRDHKTQKRVQCAILSDDFERVFADYRG